MSVSDLDENHMRVPCVHYQLHGVHYDVNGKTLPNNSLWTDCNLVAVDDFKVVD
jgi:hypothetical protein